MTASNSSQCQCIRPLSYPGRPYVVGKDCKQSAPMPKTTRLLGQALGNGKRQQAVSVNAFKTTQRSGKALRSGLGQRAVNVDALDQLAIRTGPL